MRAPSDAVSLDQFRDPRQPLPAGTPTSVLEQLRKRIKIITDDMTSIARSCCVEMTAGSALPSSPGRRVVELRPSKRSAPKRRRKPAHRRRKRDEKRVCSDTIEESVSSTSPQRKRVRTYKGSPSNLFSHVTLADSCHFHTVVSHYNNTTLPSATFRQPDNPSLCTPPHARVSTGLRVTRSFWLKSSLACNQRHGGYAGIRVGEAVNLGTATHERDRTDEQPESTHRRINEAGDSVPSSQESVTRAVQNLRISDSQRRPWPHQPRQCPQCWRQLRPKQQPRKYLGCAQCGSDPAAHVASSDHGLMLHMGQKHGGQRLLSESIGQLRHLDREACVICGTIRSRRCNRCSFLQQQYTTPRPFVWAIPFQDRRQPGHQDAARGGTSVDEQLLQSSQPAPPGEPRDDSPLPNCPIRDVVLTDRDKQLLSELRWASARALPRCVVSRFATAWAESLEGAMSGHQSWALLCRYRCRLLLAEAPKITDRNSEWKLRLRMPETAQTSDLISKKLGQQHSGPHRRTTRRVQPQTDEQRGKRACALTAQRSISKALKGLVGGLCWLSQKLDCSPHPTERVYWAFHPVQSVPMRRELLGSAGRYKAARSGMREQGRNRTGIASLPHVKLSPVECPGTNH